MDKKTTIRIGSRESRLAVIQSKLIMEQIALHHPDLDLALVTMKTTGDMILDRTLDKIGGKGLFVKELNKALQSDGIDFAVHSLKDMPFELQEGFYIAAYSQREDPRDALVLPLDAKELDLSKPLGCASQRRRVQLESLFPGCTVKPVRGNVLTRLEKLDGGQYGALVLALAGLKRLGLEKRASRIFEPHEILPAAGQGIMAAEGKMGKDYSYLKETDHKESRLAAEAERAFVRKLDGGCSSPIAAYAQISGERLALTGLYCREGESRYITGAVEGLAQDGEELGVRLAEMLKKRLGR